jgi:frataxin-like iron-binding protein CyaY
MVSNVNRGKFYRARNKYAKQLRDEFNPLLERYNIQITENEKGNSVLPISDDENVKEILNKYEDKMDDWLSQNAERRFKPEYYKKRR